MALGQPLALSWPPFFLVENGLAKGSCIVPGVRTLRESPAGGPVALGRGPDSWLGLGEPGSPAGHLLSWLVVWALDLASLSLSLSPPLKDGADRPCVAGSWWELEGQTVTVEIIMVVAIVKAHLPSMARVPRAWHGLAHWPLQLPGDDYGRLHGTKGGFD